MACDRRIGKRFELTANSQDEFLERLKSVDTDVAGTLKKRTTREREIHTFVRAFQLIAPKRELTYPICVRRRDDFGTQTFPDFSLVQGEHSVLGVEVVELVAPNYVDAREWQEWKYPKLDLNLNHPRLRWESPPLLHGQTFKDRCEKLRALDKILEPMKESVFNFMTSLELSGTEQEEVLAKAFTYWLDQKTGKLRQTASGLFGSYWLIMYDNLDTSVMVQLPELANRLERKRREYWATSEPAFDTVYVMAGNRPLFEFIRSGPRAFR